MKKLTPEQEDILLYECITDKECDKLVRQYWNLVYDKVRKTFHFKHAPLNQEDIEEAHQNVFVRLFDHDSRLLKEFDRKKGRSLTGWIVLIAGHTTQNYLREKVLTVFVNRLANLSRQKTGNRNSQIKFQFMKLLKNCRKQIE